MPLNAAVVGTTGESLSHEVDARWLMAYASGLGDTLPCYLDTLRPEGIIGHPLFPVCAEWPVIVAMRDLQARAALTAEERLRAVHATHDTIIHRLVRPGDVLTTRATIVGVEQRKPGAFETTRLDTIDAKGLPVSTTWQGGLYRNIQVTGHDRPPHDIPAMPEVSGSRASVRTEVTVPISALAAHVYTECARIWNPVHTDTAVAARAGLPGLILHGTATLALAVSQIVQWEADNTPERVHRVAGRFNAMVRMPSEITVRILSRQRTASGDVVSFDVLNAEGGSAVREGVVVLRA